MGVDKNGLKLTNLVSFCGYLEKLASPRVTLLRRSMLLISDCSICIILSIDWDNEG